MTRTITEALAPYGVARRDTCGHGAHMQSFLEDGRNVIFCSIDKHNGQHAVTIGKAPVFKGGNPK